MKGVVEIIDESAVRELNIVGGYYSQFKTTAKEWSECGFYPKKGVVGSVVDEVESREGKICIIQCTDDIYVGVCPRGLREIPFSEANRRYPMNMSVGYVSASEAKDKQAQSMMDQMENMFKSFM